MKKMELLIMMNNKEKKEVIENFKKEQAEIDKLYKEIISKLIPSKKKEKNKEKEKNYKKNSFM